MINIDKIIEIAKEKAASNIHFIYGLHPMLRVESNLIPMEEIKKITRGRFK